MSRYVFKMPDLGEGTVSAEVVAWHVQQGELVEEDQPMCEVMTEKAAVEVPAPVTGRIVSLNCQPGDMVAVGAALVVFETDAAAPVAEPDSKTAATGDTQAPLAKTVLRSADSRVMASPATRRRAHEAGIDLATVNGSGPGGRIERRDLDSALQGPVVKQAAARGGVKREGIDEIKLIGVRRVIAERMAEATRTIPHFAYVEEVDVTQLESLRRHLNGRLVEGAPSLTFLPFIAAALARVLEAFPQCNAHFDAELGVIRRHRAVHLGIATQTQQGLKVPVVRHAEALGLQALASEIRRVSEAARTNKLGKAELSGSTITLTSLGRLGGIVSTPVINMPEVAIIGINKAVERPMVVEGAFVVRRMMNLSSSFDHRFVDGYDAAAMVQALKELLEQPATIFIDA